ncbi:YhcN/YlaJ family sporulation lipoprotein [Ornithinibacillus contaminans]|uniref:YhcN/YlaJ family sporulation lipoprotein n=1 Tax=Ornithinibacillus contaminans TaxID=694055 RepID=UPI00064DAD41|nr:YhcN/YlaJ family sporulation lipoprotein [Ornithinibacillus contaminans]
MKRILLLSMISIGIFLTACSHTDSSSGEREQMLDELDPNRENKTQNNTDMQDKLGYVNYTRDQIQEDSEEHHVATLNRIEMADMIARLILRNEGFNEVATLVTDAEVLIAYDRSDEVDRETAAEIASKTAVSVMPGYFDVYVSDNESLIPDIQSLHNSSANNKNYHNTLEQIISEMKKSPQGIQHKEDISD